MGILEDIEAKSKKSTQGPLTDRSLLPGIIAFISSPFNLITGIFVPVFGQLLVLFNLFALYKYLRATGSRWRMLTVTIGIFTPIVTLVIFGGLYPREQNMLYSVLIAGSVPVSLVSTMFLMFGWFGIRYYNPDNKN